MKIALVGYGKMGKIIEKIALERKHKIVSKIEETPTRENLNHPDIVVEFTFPNSAYQNLKSCIDLGIPVVSGTTGWTKKLKEIQNYVLQKNGSFIYSSNFSLGVNLFFEINKKVASLMKNYFNYSVEIDEVHHIEKKDSPSGTAISLADDIVREYKYDRWILNKSPKNKELNILSKRIDNISGIHTVTYSSQEDYISIKHFAYSRDGFALGAVIAAEFLFNKKGIFTMKDVLGI